MKKIFFIALILFMGFTSCNISFNERIRPSGDVIVEARQVKGFSKVSVSGNIHLILTQSDTESLDIETYENLFQYIETNVTGNTLTVRLKPRIRFIGNPKIKAYLSMPELYALSASGGSKVEMSNTLKADRLSLSGSGGCSFEGTVECAELQVQLSGGGKARVDFSSGSVKAETSGGGQLELAGVADDIKIKTSGGGSTTLNADCTNLSTTTSGGGRITLAGSADHYRMSSSGGGSVKGFDLVTKHFQADMSGGGRAEITATETINMSASGGGRVNYKGGAVAQKVSLSGGGSLNKIDE